MKPVCTTGAVQCGKFPSARQPCSTTADTVATEYWRLIPSERERKDVKVQKRSFRQAIVRPAKRAFGNLCLRTFGARKPLATPPYAVESSRETFFAVPPGAVYI